MKKTGLAVTAQVAFVGLVCAALPAYAVEAGPCAMRIDFAGYSGGGETLTNFPALVVLSNNVGGSGFSFSNYPFLSTAGWDLRFATDVASTNWLNYEIESWDTNGASYVWVQVPAIPGNGSGSIWARWGNSAAGSQLACTTNGAVWTNGYVGVWHLTNGATLSGLDATTNRNDGTVYSGATATAGRMDGGADFNGTSSAYLEKGDNASLNVDKFTISAWVYLRTAGADQDKENVLTRGSYPYYFSVGAAKVNLYRQPKNVWLKSTQTFALSNWVHVAATYDGNNDCVWLNGAQVGSQGDTAAKTSTGGNLSIGRRANAASGSELDGKLDEVRLESVARSTNWIRACFMNQGSNTSFNSYGQTASLPAITNEPARDMDQSSATLPGYVARTGGAPTTVYAYLGVSPSALMLVSNLGSCAVGEVTAGVSGLMPGTTYWYTFMASNVAGVVWATSTNSFVTLSSGGSISILNAQCQSHDALGATLTAYLTETGGAPATVYGYCGTNVANWTQTSLGVHGSGETVTNDLTGLLQPHTTYAYAFLASNTLGAMSWTTTNQFSTLNRLPVASNGTLAATEDTATNFVAAGWDPDGDPVTFATAVAPAHGSLNWVSGNTVTYSPATNYNGADSFQIKAWDGLEWSTLMGTVVVAVASVNDAPTASNRTATTAPSLPVTIALSGSDVEGSPLSFTILSLPANGALNVGLGALTGSNVVYTPNPSYTGTDSFTFKVNDGELDSNTGTESLQIGWFTLGSNQNLNGSANLVATNNSCIIVPSSGVYNWANKDGSGTPAMYGLDMKGFTVADTDGSSFTLDLNGGAITNGGSIGTTRALTTGSILITNVSSVTSTTGISTICQDVGQSGYTAGSVGLIGQANGSLCIGPAGIQTYYTKSGNTGRGGDVSIQRFNGVTVGGSIGTWAGNNVGGSVSIGTVAHPIGGAIAVTGDIATFTNMADTHATGSTIGLYANGPISIRNVQSVVCREYRYAGAAAADITIVGKGAFTGGAITAGLDYNAPLATIRIDGSDGSGAFVSGAIDAHRTCYQGGAGSHVAISNFSSVAINGDVLANVSLCYQGPWNGGNLTVSGVTGDISIQGNIDLRGNAESGTPTHGTLSLTTSGGALTLSNLDMSKVNTARFGFGTTGTIASNLIAFATNWVSGSGSAASPYVTTQQVLRVPSGKCLYYSTAPATNAYLGGRCYRVADLSGTAGVGGLLAPLPGKPRGTVVCFW